MSKSPANEACWVCGGEARAERYGGELPLHRCTVCGFRFSTEHDGDTLRELYGDEYFEQYPGGESYDDDPAQRTYEARRRRAFVRRFEQPDDLLEVGSASGYFLSAMAESGVRVRGIEPAPAAGARARELFGVDVRTGFVEDQLRGDERYDTICLWHVLEHIRRPLDVVERLRCALEQGGWLFLEVPNVESVIARREGARWFHLDPAHHVGFFSPDTLRRLLERAGLVVEAVDTLPATAYLRPGRALRPSGAGVTLKHALLTKTLPRRPHPSAHELLRVVARLDYGS